MVGANVGRVAGKKALVTGAARGLGAAAARMLAREGARVALSDIDGEAVREVADAINAERGEIVAFAFTHDVCDADAWDQVLSDSADAMGGLSVVVHNAGIAKLATIEELSMADWRQSMTVNVDSVMIGTQK